MRNLRTENIEQIFKSNNITEDEIFNTNVSEESLSKAKIKATLNIIAKTLAGTLGPYGSTTLLQNQGGDRLFTKDGLDVLQKIQFDDALAYAVHGILKSISNDQVIKVGDGSTSTVIIANELNNVLTQYNSENKYDSQYDKDSKAILHKLPPKDIMNVLSILSTELERLITESSKKIETDEDLLKVASVSLNNDEKAGKVVQEVFSVIGSEGFVTRKYETNAQEDSVVFNDAVSWYSGYVHPCFGQNFFMNTAVFENSPKVFLSEHEFTSADKELLDYLIEISKENELLIICEKMDFNAIEYLRKHRLAHLNNTGVARREAKFTAVTMNTSMDTNANKMTNLSILLGLDIYSPLRKSHNVKDVIANPDNFITRVKKVSASSSETQLIPDPTIKLSDVMLERRTNAIETLEKEIADLNNKNATVEEEKRKFLLLKQLSVFKTKAATIIVGGKTMEERESRERLFEDACRACKSALLYGYVSGGNLIVPRVIKNNTKELIEKISTELPHLAISVNRICDFLDIHKFSDVVMLNMEHRLTAFLEFLLKTISDVFKSGFSQVLMNAYYNEIEINEIITECIDEDKFFNLKTHSYEEEKTTSIVNPVETDIQIMKNCFSIIGMLSTSNQFITTAMRNKK